MEISEYELKLISPQRNFFFVAYEAKGYTIEGLYNDIGARKIKTNYSNLSFTDFSIEHRSIVCSEKYHENDDDKYYKLGNNKGGYCYDVITVFMSKLNIVFLGFPFKKMTRDIVRGLAEKKHFKQNGFVSVNLTKLLKKNHSTVLEGNNYTARFSAIGLETTKNSDISSVDIGGDNVVKTKFYKDVFMDGVQNDDFKMIDGKMTIEVVSTHEHVLNYPNCNSSIYIDTLGNYRFYVHGAGRNIFTIPHLIDLLKKYKCIERIDGNPLTRGKDNAKSK